MIGSFTQRKENELIFDRNIFNQDNEDASDDEPYECGMEDNSAPQRTFIADAASQSWLYYNTHEKLNNIERGNTKSVDIDFRIGGIAVSKSGDLIATDIDNNRVVKISEDGIIEVLVNATPMSPYGICIETNDQIVVTIKNPSKLVFYSSDCTSVVREIYKEDNGKEILPRDACLVTMDNIHWKYVITN